MGSCPLGFKVELKKMTFPRFYSNLTLFSQKFALGVLRTQWCLQIFAMVSLPRISVRGVTSLLFWRYFPKQIGKNCKKLFKSKKTCKEIVASEACEKLSKKKTSKVLKNIQFWLNPDLDGEVNRLNPRAIITPRRSVNTTIVRTRYNNIRFSDTFVLRV